MSIPIEKLVCGNCGFLDTKNACTVVDSKRENSRRACSQIHKNFIDGGFTDGFDTSEIDYGKTEQTLERIRKEEIEMYKRRIKALKAKKARTSVEETLLAQNKEGVKRLEGWNNSTNRNA